MTTPVRFTLADAERAHDEWGANCGPGAIAAVAGMTLEELRPHMGDFESKRYTNPTLMWRVLRSLGIQWNCRGDERRPARVWPEYGLARVQWEGPWMDPGVPVMARYRRTHWVGSRTNGGEHQIFDINCMYVGGWVPLLEWSDKVVPWLLRECQPKADGRWHVTHSVEVAAGRLLDGREHMEMPASV